MNRARKFHVVVNHFLRDGAWDGDLERAFGRLVAAAAATRSVSVSITLAADDADVPDFESRVGDAARVRALPPGGRLPRLADILSTLDGVPDAPGAYAVYLNSDINVPSWFFEFLAMNLAPFDDHDRDALIVNRKDQLTALDQDPTAPEARFRVHPGYDAFVFPVATLSRMQLGEVTIGLVPVGSLLALNLHQLHPGLKVLKDAFVTWHEGDGRGSPWNTPEMREANLQNHQRAFDAMERLPGVEALRPPMFKDSLPGVQRLVNRFRKNRRPDQTP